jgi:quercetin dioxygenase-like cupin family protein
MALPHAAAGDLIDIRPLGATLREAISTTLIRSDHLEVFRLVLPAGERVPDHKLPRTCQLPSAITVQCLEGAVELEAQGRVQVLHAGRMFYLAGGESHALKAIEDSSVLVTMLVRRE